eukprot:m.464284 g.464284  ORF g.464284 m.464284 type:complete len:305 (+) comp23422_c0_seq1:121-1035(+)
MSGDLGWQFEGAGSLDTLCDNSGQGEPAALWWWDGGRIVTAHSSPGSSFHSSSSSRSDFSHILGQRNGSSPTGSEASMSSMAGHGGWGELAADNSEHSTVRSSASRTHTLRTVSTNVSSAGTSVGTPGRQWVVRGGPRSESDWRGHGGRIDAGDGPPTTSLGDDPLSDRLRSLRILGETSSARNDRRCTADGGARSVTPNHHAHSIDGPVTPQRARFVRDVSLFANCYSTRVDPTAIGPADAARSGWSSRHLGRASAAEGLDAAPRRRLMWGTVTSRVDPEETFLCSRRLFDQRDTPGLHPAWS